MHRFSRSWVYLPVQLLCTAVTADAAGPLTLSQAVALALAHNPELQAQGFEARIAEARVAQAGVRPNPEVVAGVEQFFGTGALSGFKGLETTVQLSQVIDLDNSRARKIEVAEGQRASAIASFETRRVDVLAEVARRFTEAVADAQRLDAARRARALGEQTVEAVRARVRALVATPIELNRARMALAVLQIEEEHAEHELLACRHALAAVLGEREPSFGDATADLMTLPDLPEFNALAERMEKSPVLARFAVEERGYEAQVRLAASLRRAGLRVSGGMRRIENTDDFGLVAGVSVPWRRHDQTAGLIREARERRDQLAPALEATRLEMRTTLFDVYQEMLHARAALTQLQKEVIPLAEETRGLAERGYREGRFTLLDLLDAQRSLVELRAQTVANAAAYHLHVVTIERLLGGPLQPVAGQP